VTHRRVLCVGIAALMTFGAAACGDDDEATATTTTRPTTTTPTTTDTAGALPPASALELEPIYGAALAELGLQLTDRGGLIDRTDGGYVPSAEGTHLALYVEPVGEARTVDEYIDGIRSVAVVFGDVFERWPGLASYDVCQEPLDDDGDPATEPIPVTQIELTKEEAAAFDWDTVTVVDLVRASRAEPRGLALRVSSTMATDDAYLAVLAAAR
jgi:hypothetical protein